MNALKQAITAVCVSSALIGAFFMITPSGKLEKSMRYLLGLLLLVLLVSPFLSLSAPKVPEVPAAADSVQSDTQLSLAKTQAEYIARVLLEAEGICPKKIEAKMDISEQSDIFISSLVVTSDGNADVIEQLLREQMAVSEVEVKDE